MNHLVLMGCEFYIMGVSKNNSTPKWMVYKGKPYEQMDDLGGNTPIFGGPPILFYKEKSHISSPPKLEAILGDDSDFLWDARIVL